MLGGNKRRGKKTPDNRVIGINSRQRRLMTRSLGLKDFGFEKTSIDSCCRLHSFDTSSCKFAFLLCEFGESELWSRWGEILESLSIFTQSEWEGEKLLPASGRPSEPHSVCLSLCVWQHTLFSHLIPAMFRCMKHEKKRRVWEGGCGKRRRSKKTGAKKWEKNIALMWPVCRIP